MRYYKVVSDGYIYLVGKGTGGDEISEQEYQSIISALSNKPTPTETTDYALTENLEWVAYALEPVDAEISKEEAFDLIFGG